MPWSYRLVPVSSLALTLAKSDLGVDDLELQSRSVKIGRNVSSLEGFKLRTEWNQFSQNHCTVYAQQSTGQALSWFVQDTSTNGTWLNDVKIAKNTCVPLSQGDVLRLSTVPGEVLTFRFEAREVPAQQDDGVHGSQDLAQGNGNKRKASQEAGEEPPVKMRPLCSSPGAPADARPGPGSPGAAAQLEQARQGGLLNIAARAADTHPTTPPMLPSSKGLAQYEKQIQDLQRKLASSRRQVDEMKREMHALKEVQVQQALAEESRVQEAERKASERSAAFSEAMQKELDATRLRAGEAAAKVAEVEAQAAAEAAARNKTEEALAAAQAQLEVERASAVVLSRTLEELQELKVQVVAMRAERDQAELRRAHEAELRAKAQEEVQAQARDMAAQQQAKEAAQRAGEAAQQQLQDAAQALHALRTARRAAESEEGALRERLDGALRRVEALEEALQAQDTESSFKRLRAEELSQLCSHASQQLLRLLQQVQGGAADLAAPPRLDVRTWGAAAAGTAGAATPSAATAAAATGAFDPVGCRSPSTQPQHPEGEAPGGEELQRLPSVRTKPSGWLGLGLSSPLRAAAGAGASPAALLPMLGTQVPAHPPLAGLDTQSLAPPPQQCGPGGSQAQRQGPPLLETQAQEVGTAAVATAAFGSSLGLEPPAGEGLLGPTQVPEARSGEGLGAEEEGTARQRDEDQTLEAEAEPGWGGSKGEEEMDVEEGGGGCSQASGAGSGQRGRGAAGGGSAGSPQGSGGAYRRGGRYSSSEPYSGGRAAALEETCAVGVERWGVGVDQRGGEGERPEEGPAAASTLPPSGQLAGMEAEQGMWEKEKGDAEVVVVSDDDMDAEAGEDRAAGRRSAEADRRLGCEEGGGEMDGGHCEREGDGGQGGAGGSLQGRGSPHMGPEWHGGERAGAASARKQRLPQRSSAAYEELSDGEGDGEAQVQAQLLLSDSAKLAMGSAAPDAFVGSMAMFPEGQAGASLVPCGF